MTRIARYAGALLLRGQHVLLARRGPDRRTSPDSWDVVGGHVEQGESFEQAAVREVAEELGVRAVLDRELARSPLPRGGEYRLYLVTRWSGEPHLANDEHVELRWFTIEEACALDPLASAAYVDVFRALAAASSPPRSGG